MPSLSRDIYFDSMYFFFQKHRKGIQAEKDVHANLEGPLRELHPG